ncbi:MAG TPA: D-tyrosyl-tRNA(Tyr) deacylase [Gammaproteobacteria bacterium]|nr:MAG: D-tyrosyl-tRNA(Tyr) deacylase [Methylothermaceae bacteria B42]HEC17783.1 D-tyrosyl-tRNA(Tyr) deacylase [Gammaproteobacteria bacterium]
MIAVIQRVNQACVTVAGETVGKIGRGILVLAAVEKGDTQAQVQRMAQRLLSYRIFPDEADKMNLSVRDIDGELLLVSQFTLAADTRKGTRPSFTPAADPETGRRLFEALVDEICQQYPRIQTGRFGANMQVSLVNDGPVTFIIRASSGQE